MAHDSVGYFLPLRIAATLTTLVFFALALHLAWTNQIDYFDSFNFINQAQRLFSEDLYQWVAYDTTRPRVLVIVLALFHTPYQWLLNAWPQISHLHLYMVFWTGVYFAVWYRFTKRFADKTTAQLLLILMAINPVLLHYSFPVMTDILSGICLCLFYFYVAHTIEREQKNELTRTHAVVLGLMGALVGSSKHHFVPLLPFTVGLIWLFKPSRRSLQWEGLCLFVYALGVDLATRFFGKWGEGFGPHVKHIAKQALAAGNEATSPWLFLDALYQMYGPVFLLVTALALFLSPPQIKSRQKISRQNFFFVTLSVVFMGLTQLTAHREVRYLLPFLPVLLIPAAFATAKLLTRSRQPWLSRLLFALWIGSLWVPVSHSWAGYKRFKQDPVYDAEASGLSNFVESLQKATCSNIRACDFAFESRPFEYPLDWYYRKYDFGPNLVFYTHVQTRYGACPTESVEASFAHLYNMIETPPPQTCFLVPFQRPEGRKLLLFRQCTSNRLDSCQSTPYF